MRWALTLGCTLGSFVGIGNAQEPPKKKPIDPETVFKKIDKNADRSVSLAELRDHLAAKPPKAAEKAFQAMDADKSGGVSLNEFKAWAKKQAGEKKT
jgi:Ca2+-binding EF-hand superfamily protein